MSRGWWTLARFRGAPIRVHWTLPLGALIWSGFRFEPAFWVHILLWPILLLGGTIGLLRPLKAIMVAQQYHHRSTESDLDQ